MKKKKPPFLIALEGIDYSGKSTQRSNIEDWLSEELKIPAWGWEEPNDYSDIGKKIRQMLKKEVPKEPDPFEFQRMYVIDRAQNIFCLLRENFDLGRTTVLARYALSTIAYGMLCGRPADDFVKLHNDVLGPSMFWPDLTIILDIPPEVFEERIRDKNRKIGLEQKPQHFEKLDVLRQVRENYLAAAKRNDVGPVVVIDGTPTEEEVFERLKAIITERFEIARAI